MIICLFGTRYRPDADLDLERELLADLYARLSDWPGFVGTGFYAAPDGEMLGVIRFTSRAALEAWREDEAHRATWQRASEIYSEFWIQTAETYREYRWLDGRRVDGDLESGFRERWALDRQAIVRD